MDSKYISKEKQQDLLMDGMQDIEVKESKIAKF